MVKDKQQQNFIRFWHTIYVKFVCSSWCENLLILFTTTFIYLEYGTVYWLFIDIVLLHCIEGDMQKFQTKIHFLLCFCGMKIVSLRRLDWCWHFCQLSVNTPKTVTNSNTVSPTRKLNVYTIVKIVFSRSSIWDAVGFSIE